MVLIGKFASLPRPAESFRRNLCDFASGWFPLLAALSLRRLGCAQKMMHASVPPRPIFNAPSMFVALALAWLSML
jgi:hypothetical protein